MAKRIISFAALLFLVTNIGAAGQITTAGDDARFPAAGALVPSRELARLGLRPGDLRGRPALLEFWAPWCSPCVRQLPRLDSLAVEFGERAIVIAIATRTSRESAAAVAKKNPTRRLIHKYDVGDSLATAFKVYGVPRAFVVDENRRIAVSPAESSQPMNLDEFVSILRRRPVTRWR